MTTPDAGHTDRPETIPQPETAEPMAPGPMATGPMAPAQPLSRLDRAILAALLTVMGAELVWLATGALPARLLSGLGVLSVVAIAAPRFSLREVYLLTVCSALSAGVVWVSDTPGAVLAGALDQAAFLMAFILLIGLLQQAASTSEAIRTCGIYLTRQPPGRRYLSVFLGTHFMAQLFNLGVVSLLTPLIRRGSAAGAEDDLGPIRERRQLGAMLRGFAWGVVWSPTAVAPLVLATLLPEAERLPWIAAGAVIALVILVVGWAEDRARFAALRRARGTSARPTPPPFPRGAYARLAGVATALLGITLAAMLILGGSVVFGLMIASPLVMLGWLALQAEGPARNRLTVAGTNAAAILRRTLPPAAPLAVTLACSGYIGRAAAALIPAEQWAEALGIAAMPGWLFLLGLSVTVALLSQFALSPIMMAVFVGSLIAELPVLPADITWAALAISCGWALSMTSSPFATVVLMIEQATGHSGRRLTWFWNGRFTALSIAVLAVSFWLLDRFA
ncbi:MAG: hypothetical protein AAF675_10330 [Pseudomonadota bacterium]